MRNRIISKKKPSVMGIIMAGGAGNRLLPLTEKRAKAALHFGGCYRLVDFVLSNFYHSDIDHIGLITQYNSTSLLKHINSPLSSPMKKATIDLLPAQQKNDQQDWYKGTADSVRQNLDTIKGYNPEYIVIAAADHVYTVDFRESIDYHIQKGADLTILAKSVPLEMSRGFGIIGVDDDYQINAFIEKPSNPPTIPHNPDHCYASMGIYIYTASFLYSILEADPSYGDDFGHDIIPASLAIGKGYTYDFDSVEKSFWYDIATPDDYWRANMDLTSGKIQLEKHHWPIMTTVSKGHNITRISGALHNTVLGDGCTVGHKSSMEHSVLFSHSEIGSKTNIRESLILPGAHVGENCNLHRVIVEKNVKIPNNMTIGLDPINDKKNFHYTDNGITIVTKKNILKFL
ncbi:MAG: sugar phosphate nucleotidyltransferase [Alphaproteobacteria bacterium]|nr:sugar phosphate nucleotidyltransferase [Alphaproteobacteria bacterium]